MCSIVKGLSVDEDLTFLKKCDLDLTDPKIFNKIVEHYKDIVGEKSNIKLIFLAAISRKLPRKLRIHINNYSTSGAGKSWLMRKVLKPFQKDVEEVTRFTDAWLSRTIGELEGKILLWQEINRTDEQGRGTTGQLKILLTDEGISYRFMENTAKGWLPRNGHSDALPVVITTTTRQLNGEDSRRFFILNIDESEEQTSLIVKHELTKASSINFKTEIDKKYQQLEILVGFYEKLAEDITDTLIPFSPYLEKMLPLYLQMRTDVTKLIQLTKLVAFIHILNRKLVVKKNGGEEKRYLVADVEDLKEAIEIASKIFGQSTYGLSEGSLKVYDFVKNYDNPYSEVYWPTIKQCQIGLDLPHSTLYSYVDPLIEKGFLDKEDIEGSREKCLSLTMKRIERLSLKEFEYTEDKFQEWFKNEFGNEGKLVDFKDVLYSSDDS